MKANYHTHTPRCKHAIGSEEQYIQNAIKAHFDVIGFADHTPWHYETDFIPFMRMEETELDDYLSTLLALKEKYKDQIEIRIGLECEYFEGKMDYLKTIMKEKPIDYIILGNHYYQSDETGIYFGSLTYDHLRLIQYVDAVCKAIDTNLYSYVAHPDLVNYYNRKSDIYKQEMTKLILKANEHHLPLEFNLLGFASNRNYPNPEFWTLAAQYHAKAIIGYDAHDPAFLLNDALHQQAISYLNSLNIEIVDSIEYNKIK